MRSPIRSRKQRIKDITSQISELSAELEHLLNLSDDEDANNRSSPPPARTKVHNHRWKSSSSREQEHQTSTDIQDGDRVVVHRDNKGYEGKKGTIASSSKCYVWIRIDNERSTIQKSRLNVTKI